MNLTSVFALMLFAAQAWSCPNLTGQYMCQVEGHPQLLEITQTEANGVTTYNVNGDQIVANGVVEKLPDDDNMRNITQKFWCEGEVLRGQANLQIFEEEVAVGEAELWITGALDAARNFVQNEGGTYVDLIGKQVETLPENTVTCQRLQ